MEFICLIIMSRIDIIINIRLTTIIKENMMRHILKYTIAIIIYLFFTVVVDFIMGIGMKDQWDKFMKFSKK